VVFPTSKLSNNVVIVPPESTVTVIKYPVATLSGFHTKSKSAGTSASPSRGEMKVVHSIKSQSKVSPVMFQLKLY